MKSVIKRLLGAGAAVLFLLILFYSCQNSIFSPPGNESKPPVSPSYSSSSWSGISSSSSSVYSSSSSSTPSSSSSSCGCINDGYLVVTVESNAAPWNNDQFASIYLPDATGYTAVEFDYKVNAGTNGGFGFFIQDSGNNNSGTVLLPQFNYDGNKHSISLPLSDLINAGVDLGSLTQWWFIVLSSDEVPTIRLIVEIDNLRITGGGADIILFDGGTDNLGSGWDTSAQISVTKLSYGTL